MKNTAILFFFGMALCAIPSGSSAADPALSGDTLNNISLDLLFTPTLPAFNLMSTSPSEITEPGSAPDFYVSLQNASNNFSAIPNNFGFAITPFWWTKKAEKLDFDESYSADIQSIKDIQFFRSLKVSAGVVKGIKEDEKLWRYGFGISSTLFSGRIDETLKQNYFNLLSAYNSKYFDSFEEYINNNWYCKKLQNERDNLLVAIGSATDTQRREWLIRNYKEADSVYSDCLNKLHDQFIREKKFIKDSANISGSFSKLEKRIGYKMDIGGGFATDIENNKLDSIGLYRAGIWTNFGWTFPFKNENYLSIFFLSRFMYYHDHDYYLEGAYIVLKSFSSADFGMQIKLDFNPKLSFLLEAIYQFGSDAKFENTYKLNSLLQYKFRDNKLVFVSFGNDLNEVASGGPADLVLNVGLNIGFGEDVSLYSKNF